MVKWSKDHMAAIDPFKFETLNLCLMSDTMEIGWGKLGEPVEHSEGNGGESVVAILSFCVVALACVG
jgi:hypothetical protein